MRPEKPRGTCTVTAPPLAGPAIALSGAGDGGFEPAGHARNVPPPSTQPSLPVARFVPSTWTNTCSPRPDWFATVIGSRSGPSAAAGVAAPMTQTAPATSAV